MANPEGEPMQDEELIRLSLEAFHVQLQFETMTLQIGVMFWVTRNPDEPIQIDPVAHRGDIGPLWSLIGERVRSVVWSEEIELAFTNGARLRIPAAIDKAPRGTLIGRGTNDAHLVEDF